MFVSARRGLSHCCLSLELLAPEGDHGEVRPSPRALGDPAIVWLECRSGPLAVLRTLSIRIARLMSCTLNAYMPYSGILQEMSVQTVVQCAQSHVSLTR